MAASGDGTGALSSSITDLMTSLAVIFILLLVASLNNAQQEGEQTRNAIVAALLRELQSFVVRGVEVETDPKDPLSLLVLVPEGLLEFALNDDRIPSGGVDFLGDFIPQLASATCSPRFRQELSSIVVEGHTDSTGGPAINLPLSQRRSMSVSKESLRILSMPGAESAADLSTCFLELLSASGRGSVEPILDANGQEDCARSRRVVFKIRVRSIEQKELKEILGGPAPALARGDGDERDRH
ncbi:MAG: OmpA family protein [Candidatus Schekmanbacteria bacterium]|nr:OmpA family protein [Candidatus Schekmanbacteria bacterium]